MLRAYPTLPACPLRVVVLFGTLFLGCQPAAPGWALRGPDASTDHDAPTGRSPDDAGSAPIDAGPETDAMRTRCVPAAVVLAEVLYDPEGADGRGEREFVELRGPVDARLHGYTVEIVDGATGRTLQAVTVLDDADAAGRFVVGGSAVAAARAYFTGPLPNGPDLARLWSCDGTLLDEVRWGSWTDGTGHGVASAQALARCDAAPSGWWPAPPTPGQATSPFATGPCAETTLDAGTTDALPTYDAAVPTDAAPAPETDAAPEPDCDPAATAGLRISELLPDPVGTDTAETEFFELIVPEGARGATVLATLWDGATGAIASEAELRLPDAGTRVIVGGGLPDSIALPFALQNGPDALVISNCAGEQLDGIAWGPGSRGLADALGVDDGGTVRSGESLARCADLGPPLAASPTPGAPNAGFRDAGACDAACPPTEPEWMLIHEVLFDPPGRDGTGELEFIELLGPAGASIRGWTLTGIDGDTGNRWLGPLVLEGSFNADGLLVVGGSGVVHDVPLPVALQNGPDGIRVARCDGRSSDALAWGQASGSFVGEGAPASSPREGSALCRGVDAVDTGDNARDFAACVPSPGTR